MISSTTATSPAGNVPDGDLSAQAFTLYRSEYTLPKDVMQVGRAYPNSSMIASYNSVQGQHQLEKWANSSGAPYTYTVVKDRHLPQRLAMQLFPYPSTAETVEFPYRAHARKLVYTGLASRDRVGTVALSGTTVTGTGTTFEAGMVGSVIRLSSTAVNYPTDDVGDFPAAWEGIIEAVASTSSLTVRSNANGASYSGVKYTVTDPIDLSDTLFNLLLRACEKQAEIVRQREGSGKGDAMQLFMEELSKAKGAECKTNEPFALGVMNNGQWFRDLERNLPATFS